MTPERALRESIVPPINQSLRARNASPELRECIAILCRRSQYAWHTTGRHLECHPCSMCRSWTGAHGVGTGSIAHHWDYSKPMDVVWLCWPCHAVWHKRFDRLMAALSAKRAQVIFDRSEAFAIEAHSKRKAQAKS